MKINSDKIERRAEKLLAERESLRQNRNETRRKSKAKTNSDIVKFVRKNIDADPAALQAGLQKILTAERKIVEETKLNTTKKK